MLVPFAIDAESLAPENGEKVSAVRSSHHDLLKVWRELGLLVHDSGQFQGSRLETAVMNLPPYLRPLWLEVLERAPRSALGGTWDGTLTPDSLKPLSSTTRLGLLDDAHAYVNFGLEEDAAEDEIGLQVEGEVFNICRLQAANRASAFQTAAKLAKLEIRQGETYEEIWNGRIRPLAQAQIKTVCVVDRYAVTRHFRCEKHVLSGVERFIRLLESTATSARYLTIYSAWTEEIGDMKMDDVVDEFREVFRRNAGDKIKEIKIVMIGNTEFGAESHGRFIRFGDYAWVIDTGLDVFEGPRAKAVSDSFLVSGDEVFSKKAREVALMACSTVKTKIIDLKLAFP